MAKYRPVDVRIWSDRKFLELSSDARLLWVFLLTAPSALPIPGVVIGGDLALAEQLGWTPELLRERFAELFAKRLSVKREGRLIWLPNALKYQRAHNPNMLKGWAATWDEIPDCDLKLEIWQALELATKSWSRLFGQLFSKPFGKQLHQPLPKPFAKQIMQDQDQDQDQDQEEREPARAPAHAIPASADPVLPSTKKEDSLSLVSDWVPRIGSEAANQLERMGPAGNRSRLKFIAKNSSALFESQDHAESRLLCWLLDERNLSGSLHERPPNGNGTHRSQTPLPTTIVRSAEDLAELERMRLDAIAALSSPQPPRSLELDRERFFDEDDG